MFRHVSCILKRQLKLAVFRTSAPQNRSDAECRAYSVCFLNARAMLYNFIIICELYE
jgi:hypothetical protein